jgi:hypothetical protein
MAGWWYPIPTEKSAPVVSSIFTLGDGILQVSRGGKSSDLP